MMKALVVVVAVALVLGSIAAANGDLSLSPQFYEESCPEVKEIIKSVFVQAARTDPRLGASLIRLHFHDCFVDGCDGSILLDNATGIISEKDAAPNANSARGFEVVDAMKQALEDACPGIVSCADILALSSQVGVTEAGGPEWDVPLGRLDGRTANKAAAGKNLPSPFDSIAQIRASFVNVGLNNGTDLVALSGAHTFGRARCGLFRDRLYGKPDRTMDPTYADALRRECPETGNASVLVELDPTTPDKFDRNYFGNLLAGRGLLRSDQVLFSTPGAADTTQLVSQFAANQTAFFEAFVSSMVRMGGLSPPAGAQGEVRLRCREVNDLAASSR